MKIVAKLTIAFLCVALIVLFVGYFSAGRSQDILQKNIENNSAVIAQNILNKIDRRIFTLINMLQDYTYDSAMQNAVTQSNQEFSSLENIDEYIHQNDTEWVFSSPESLTTFMQQLLDNDLSKELNKKLTLYEKNYDRRVFGEMFITNKYGANIALTSKTTDYYQKDEQWWQLAKKNGFYVEDIGYDESADTYSLNISLRIDNESGNFLGVIKAVLDIEDVIILLKESEKSTFQKGVNSAHFQLITADGRIIYESGKSEYLKKISSDLFLDLESADDGKLTFVTERDEEGKKVLYSHVHSKGYGFYKGFNWILSIKHQEDEIFAPVNQLRGILLLAAFIASILAIALGLFVSQSISNSIGKLKTAAVQIGEGKLDTKVEIKSKDELGELAHVFNQMIADLKNVTASRDELSKEIIDRKKAEAALIKEKQNAESANRTKSQFLATMSHEIRTPMNAILGFVEIVQGTPLTDEQREYLNTVESSGKVLLSVINDILDISKVEAGEITLEKIDFNLAHLAEDVMRMIRPRLQGKPLELYFTIGEDVPLDVEGDPTRLRQILINLIANAIKFTETGKVGLEIIVSKKAMSDGNLIHFTIRDTGVGIPSDRQKAIFEAFTQVDMSSTRKYEGTGLGLSICKAYVEAMGGSIGVDSELGKGSAFYFLVPFKTCAPVVEKGIFPLSIEDLKNKKVLVVDNNAQARQLLQLICKEFQMIMYEFSKSQDVLDWLNQTSEKDLPDFALLEIMMPHMDGYELCRAIRQHSRYDGMKLISITSDVKIGVTSQMKDSGFDGFIPKPITIKELLQVIETVLGDKREQGPIVTRHMAEELSCKGLTVLVAEDNIINQKLIKVLLQNLGCVTEVVNNGKEVLERLREKTYDVVLMDLLMPEMDGVEATKIIRSEISKDLPVIALTAAVLKEDEERCYEVGMNDFLIKPINTVQLKEKLLQWGKQPL